MDVVIVWATKENYLTCCGLRLRFICHGFAHIKQTPFITVSVSLAFNECNSKALRWIEEQQD